MRLTQRSYFYLMPRTAKVCELARGTFLALGMVALAGYLITRQKHSWLYRAVLLTCGAGTICMLTRQILRVPFRGSNFIQKTKYFQLSALLTGTGLGLVSLSIDQESKFQKWMQVSSGALLGSTAVSHLALKLL